VEDVPLWLAPAVEAESELSPEAVGRAKGKLREVLEREGDFGGYEVFTTIDPALQAEARRAVRDNLAAYAERHGRTGARLEDDALSRIRSHCWPGNVRELEHWIESAVVLAADGRIRARHLPEANGAPRAAAAEAPADDGGALHVPMGLELSEVTRRYIEATVEACDGNKTEAARRLGIGRNTVNRALSREE
ncbi:MAG: helix-turn-helix domain-containing protein, partial [Polyangiales bacterium]